MEGGGWQRGENQSHSSSLEKRKPRTAEKERVEEVWALVWDSCAANAPTGQETPWNPED